MKTHLFAFVVLTVALLAVGCASNETTVEQPEPMPAEPVNEQEIQETVDVIVESDSDVTLGELI